MPNDLSIPAVAQPNPGSSAAAPSKPAVAAAPVEQTTPTATDAPNPTMALNAALGLVVIEFRNNAGAITNSIPTVQQMQAYQLWQVSGIGRPPNLGASMSAAVPGAAPAPAPAPPSTPTPASASTPASAKSGGASRRDLAANA